MKIREGYMEIDLERTLDSMKQIRGVPVSTKLKVRSFQLYETQNIRKILEEILEDSEGYFYEGLL